MLAPDSSVFTLCPPSLPSRPQLSSQSSLLEELEGRVKDAGETRKAAEEAAQLQQAAIDRLQGQLEAAERALAGEREALARCRGELGVAKVR